MLTKQLDIVYVESSFSINILRFKKLIKECCEVYFCFIVEAIPDPWKSTHVVTVSTKHTASAITCPILKLILQTTYYNIYLCHSELQ